MLHKQLERKYSKLLAEAGIRINGDRPWDLRIHNHRVYARTLLAGSLGFGEAYLDGWWDCEQLDEFFTRAFRAELNRKTGTPARILSTLRPALTNLQKIKRAFHVGDRHYNLGCRLFQRMLDRRMIYSCGYWKNAHDLDQAQEAKLRLIFDKLLLKPGMQVLDIGCGWGGAVRFAAEHYDVSAVGVTVSSQQAEYARDLCRGLPVEIQLQDYRDIRGRFDRAYSIGMFEHVGCKNYRTYMCTVRKVLKDDGLFLLHTIGSLRSTLTTEDPWIAKYIFPNSMLPSIAQIGKACEPCFVVEDLQNFGADYDKTLMAWFENFSLARDELKADYDERFCRMWQYYLLACAGAFRARENQLWQVVLSPAGIDGRYDAPR